MSFSMQQKDLILNGVYKSACCRRALLSGVLFAKGRLTEDGVFLSLDRRETADLVSKLTREFYGTDGEIYHESKGGRRIILRFKSSSAERYITNIEKNGEFFAEKCQICRASFLKGVFLGAGRAGDPEKTYIVEFSLEKTAQHFAGYLDSLKISCGITKSEKKTVYLRSNASVEEFFANAGMNTALFSVIEAKFEKDTKRSIQRVTNCDTSNIAKTVRAAGSQLEIISALAKADLLSSLPDELETTARLRLDNPDLSLAQLSAISVPKVSKPGLSHRLKKIIELGEALLHK